MFVNYLSSNLILNASVTYVWYKVKIKLKSKERKPVTTPHSFFLAYFFTSYYNETSDTLKVDIMIAS